MSLQLKVPEPLSEQLQHYCQTHDRTADEVVGQLLRDFLDREPSAPTPYELWQRVFTAEGSGEPDLGRRAKAHLKDKLHARHSG